MNGMKRIWG